MGFVTTATRRHCSADAVHSLGMLGKCTDSLRETCMFFQCLSEAWLDLHMAD